MTNRRLRRELRDFTNKTEQPLKLYSGALGITIGGTRYVDVPTRPGFVYVRLRNNVSELIQAHNQQVSPVYDLPVLVVRSRNYYEIYSRDSEQYASYWVSNSSYLPKHGFQHEFDPDNGGGGDLVFVHGEQFYPLMGFPSGTDAANNILIAPYRYYYNNAWHYAGGTGTADLLQYRPTGSANSKLVLVGLDATTGNPFVKIGTEFSASITGAAAMTSYVPTNITLSVEIPGTIVRLVTGTSVITWANIYDARQYMGILQASTGSSGATTFLALNDTPDSYSGQGGKFVAVNSGATGLEFVTAPTGSGSSGGGGTGFIINANTGTSTTYARLSGTVNGTNTLFAVSEGAYSSGKLLVILNGQIQTQGTNEDWVETNPSIGTFNFNIAPAVGDKIITVNGSSGTSGGGGEGGGNNGVVIYDDNVFKVTGTAISFDNNLSVVTTGSTAYVSAAASLGRTLIQTNRPLNVTGTTFSSIPQTYKNLEIIYTARASVSTANMSIFFNGDIVTANYRIERLNAQTTTVGGFAGDSSIIGVLPGGADLTGTAGSGRIEIPEYTGPLFNKTALVLSGYRTDAATITLRNVYVDWEQQSPINKIELGIDSGSFITGSVFYLYGE